jgi:hypothetical protein
MEQIQLERVLTEERFTSSEALMGVLSGRRLPTALTAAAILALLCSAVRADSTDGGQSAVWTHKEFKFTYQGFTTKYSCDGLADKVREIVLTFGARKDLKVSRWGCAGSSGVPDPFPGVAVKMNVLVPASAATAASGEPAVAAHWQSVKLRLDRSSLSEAGECELVEQVKQKILPLFTTRNVDYRNTCVPHQLTPGGTQLGADVLVADPAAAGATAAS